MSFCQGLCHVCPSVQRPVSPCAPPSIAPDTDLLVGSVLSPRSPCTRPSPRLVAGHQPLARAEGQPIQGINPCTSRSDPSVQAGLLGCWGACGMGSRPWPDAGVPRPRGWPRGPHAGQPSAVPASSKVLGPEQVHKGLWDLAPLHPTFPRGLSGFSTATVFSLVSPRFSGLWRTTLTPALSAAGGGGGAPAALPPACQLSTGQGPPLGARALTAFCAPRSRSPGQCRASPQPGSFIRPRLVHWSLCKGCPGRSMGGKVGTDRAPPRPSPAGCDP